MHCPGVCDKKMPFRLIYSVRNFRFLLKKRNNAGGDVRIRTGDEGFAGLCLTTWPRRHLRKQPAQIDELAGLLKNGADNGVRTRDPHLGKVVLYQLSHVRKVLEPSPSALIILQHNFH